MGTASKRLAKYIAALAILLIALVIIQHRLGRPATLQPSATGLHAPGGAHPAMAICGGQLLVAARSELAIFDLDESASPCPTGGANLHTEEPADVQMRGQYAYVASVDDKHTRLEITRTSEPPVSNTLTWSNDKFEYWKVRFDIVRGLLYMPLKSSKLAIIDISTPADPKQVATVNLGTMPVVVRVSGNTAFVGTEEKGVLAVDITDPRNPTIVGRCRTPQATDHKGSLVRDVAVAGNILYAACGVRGVALADVTDPSHMRIVGRCAPGPLEAWCDYTAASVQPEGRYLYVGVGERGIRVFDVSRPQHCRLVAKSDGLGMCYQLAVKDRNVYAWLFGTENHERDGLALFRFPAGQERARQVHGYERAE